MPKWTAWQIVPKAALEWLTPRGGSQSMSANKRKKDQIRQLWRKNDTGDVYLVTRVYSEALSTMCGAAEVRRWDEARRRLRAENTLQRAGYSGILAGAV